MPSPSSSSTTAAPRQRPSPSLSPSINALLSDSDTPFAYGNDYFTASSTTPSQPPAGKRENDVEPVAAAAPPNKRPRPSTSSPPTPASATLADTTTHPMNPPPPRPSSSSSSSNTSAPSSSFSKPPAPTSATRAPPPLEPSVFNVEPIDEFTREVADWLWGFCAPLDWDKVEIEAKIGLLVDNKSGGQRVYLPVPTEAILTDDTGLRFQSNMTVTQHKAFNQLLNARVVETSHPQYPHARIAYSHTHELDTFHHLVAEKRKIRVTRDEKKRDPNSWKAVEKVRVADMNVFSPKRWFDWRVSISLENPVTELPTTPASHSRRKDRISYSHQLYQIDLTQVTTPSTAATATSAPPPPPTHELEIEFKDAKKLLIEADKESRGEKNWYLQGVQGMLNNVRMLIRNASEPGI
ncbi:mRNA triphosphatase [Sporobolomyces koalae]|uniref:mRNA triphosphatase n=1 Tax=Sporobolomyces koalae TaxID=500713 RepID=UPI00317A8801